MKKKTRRMCGLIGGICLLLFATKVYAADCIIEIQLEDLKVPWSDRENVTMALYDVGEVSTYGEPKLDPSFGIPQYPQTADDSKKAVEQIEHKLPEEPLMRQQTDAQGRVSFSGLPSGVYLIKAEQAEHYGTVISALTHLPYYEIVNDEKLGPLYTIRVNPKAAKPEKPGIPTATPTPPEKPETPTDTPTPPEKPETPTDTPTPPEKPETPTDTPTPSEQPETPTHTPKPSEKPETEPTPTVTAVPGQGGGDGGDFGGSNTPGKGQSVKTGDGSHPAEWFGLLAASAVLAGAVIHKRRKVSE